MAAAFLGPPTCSLAGQPALLHLRLGATDNGGSSSARLGALWVALGCIGGPRLGPEEEEAIWGSSAASLLLPLCHWHQRVGGRPLVSPLKTLRPSKDLAREVGSSCNLGPSEHRAKANGVCRHPAFSLGPIGSLIAAAALWAAH